MLWSWRSKRWVVDDYGSDAVAGVRARRLRLPVLSDEERWAEAIADRRTRRQKLAALAADAPDYTVDALHDGIQPCAIPCAVCSGALGPTVIQVGVTVGEVTRTEIVCSEGCAIRFVGAGGLLIGQTGDDRA